MKISVTQDHINRGTKQDCSSCPVALAVQETCNSPTLWAGYQNIQLPNRCTITPPEVKDFMTRFDKNLPVSPFTFEV